MDDSLVQWVQSLFRDHRQDLSENAEVEWERVDPDDTIDETQVTIDHREHPDRPRKTLDNDSSKETQQEESEAD